MISLNEQIKELIPTIVNNKKKYFIAPDIPEQKLNSIVKSICPSEELEYIISFVDTSLLGTANEGFVFFGDKIVFKKILSPVMIINFDSLEEVTYIEEVVTDKKGKSKIEKLMTVRTELGLSIIPSSVFSLVDGNRLQTFLNQVIQSRSDNEEVEFVTENQLLPLEQMKEEVKTCYAKILCNYAYFGDEMIDSEEYSEIMSFVVRVNMQSKNRILIRSYMLENDLKEDTEELLSLLEKITTDSEFAIVKQSLMKDILVLYGISNDTNIEGNNNILYEIAMKLEINDDQLEIIKKSIQKEKDIIDKRLDDTEIKKSLKEISASAIAVGVPMAALYFSGSMIGVSAAGMTSGLAALGMGGALGFSSMFTGVGMLALIGVGTYQGVKKITGFKDLENNKQREKLLQAIIINSQKTLNVIIEDVNTISGMLVNEMKKGQTTQIQIEKLAQMVGMLSKGANTMSSKITFAEGESLIAKLPKIIDEDRLSILTDKPTLKNAKIFILDCYSKEDLGELSLAEIRELYDVMDRIGYLNLKDASIASAKSSVKKMASGFLK